jgi:mono/diheme cytochrome c family protein
MRRLLTALLIVMAVAGCTRSNMDSQPKYHEYEPGWLFRDGKVLQAPVPGTVARGDIERDNEAAFRPKVTAELLGRGRAEYDVYCSPCHGRTGTGSGIVVQRGFPKPASLHDERLRAADDQHYFDVITTGFGVMYAHGDRVQPRDRWAIVAYIRALQLSQRAALADVPTEEQTRMAIESKP